jgi:hypothetical protein
VNGRTLLSAASSPSVLPRLHPLRSSPPDRAALSRGDRWIIPLFINLANWVNLKAAPACINVLLSMVRVLVQLLLLLSLAPLLVRTSPVLPYRLAVFRPAVPRSSNAVYLAPECQRFNGIIKRVVSADKMTSPPSKMIPSSINNLSIWYRECAPIAYRLHLFGRPSHCRLSHNFHYYNTLNPAFTLILFCPTAIPSPYDRERFDQPPHQD